MIGCGHFVTQDSTVYLLTLQGAGYGGRAAVAGAEQWGRLGPQLPGPGHHDALPQVSYHNNKN